MDDIELRRVGSPRYQGPSPVTQYLHHQSNSEDWSRFNLKCAAARGARYICSVIPVLRREEWDGHPHFPHQTLLLEAHDGFRRRSAWILAHLGELSCAADERRKRSRWLRRMSTDFNWWMSGMKGHERYEERKLYRYLEQTYGADFTALEADHRQLHVHRVSVEQAFDRAINGDGDAHDCVADVIGELEAHRAFLGRHLDAEEDYVIPMLLALTPEEFKRYYNTPSDVLLG